VGLKWDLLATLLIAWGIVYLIICKGLHASGKVKTTFILGVFSSTFFSSTSLSAKVSMLPAR
jgi:hypothetical protein